MSLLLHNDAVPSSSQVSLARSAPLKDEDGKCVGLMLTSYDRTLVIKEISSEEVEEMHIFLSEYHQVNLTHLCSYYSKFSCHGKCTILRAINLEDEYWSFKVYFLFIYSPEIMSLNRDKVSTNELLEKHNLCCNKTHLWLSSFTVSTEISGGR